MIFPEFIPKPASKMEEKEIFENNIHAGFAYNQIESDNEAISGAIDSENKKNSNSTQHIEKAVEFSNMKVEQNINLNSEKIDQIEYELINEYGHTQDNLDEKLVFAERSDRPNDQHFIDHYNEIHYLRSQLIEANQKLQDKLDINQNPESN